MREYVWEGSSGQQIQSRNQIVKHEVNSNWFEMGDQGDSDEDWGGSLRTVARGGTILDHPTGYRPKCAQ